MPAAAVKPTRLDPNLVLIHWMAALLVVLGVSAMELRWLLPSGHAARPWLRDVHLWTGQLVLLSTLVRLVVRWRSPLPPAQAGGAWARFAARAVHWALYGVLLTQPVLGVVFMQAGDKTVHLFGSALPALVAPDPDLHAQVKDAHKLVGQALYGLLGLHVAAALWHHYLLKDGTLVRMLRWQRRPVLAVAEAALAAETPQPAATTPARAAQPTPSNHRHPAPAPRPAARVEETTE